MALLHFKALSDETRLRLVHILLHYELSVNELVRILGMGQSRVSRHLKILTEAGLLTSRRDGLWVFYAAPRAGRERDFLRAVMPFVPADAVMRADLGMAAQILEERARKTRQFFNAIAEDWDELNREVLGAFDLAETVCAAVPDGCGTAVDLGCGTGAVLGRLLPLARGVIGVDGSARMLELCRRRFSQEELGDGRVSCASANSAICPCAIMRRTLPASTLCCTICPRRRRACARSAGSWPRTDACLWPIFCATTTKPCAAAMATAGWALRKASWQPAWSGPALPLCAAPGSPWVGGLNCC